MIFLLGGSPGSAVSERRVRTEALGAYYSIAWSNIRLLLLPAEPPQLLSVLLEIEQAYSLD
jgi:hypothetical protein